MSYGYIYKRIEQPDETFKIGQYFSTDGFRRFVDDDYHDYVNWMDEGNSPEVIDYIPPPEPEFDLETKKDIKILEIETKTKSIFATGVPATVDGTEYLFDTRTGERAATNWQILDSTILRAISDSSFESLVFPRNISTINDEYILTLNTAAEANAFWIELMTNDNDIAIAGATLRKQVKEATTQEELDAIVDNR